ncbi:uncharacterized protein LOC102721153 [Oryza brachyantha]|uniref:uncharacterized protein LOC102721153 n=1 Tax=Oryza brachyantha TaxID=4533 RepID=UPI001AD95CE0|nr:uncharacterized protein LOC102721153 [Oryza brachyantha]
MRMTKLVMSRDTDGGGGGAPPDTPLPPPGAASSSENSPVFDFIKTLSPIATSKRLYTAPNAQLFKSSDLAHTSSIFTSPQVTDSRKGSKISIGNTSARLSQEGLCSCCHTTQIGTSCYIKQSEVMTIPSENCSTDCSLSQAYHDSPGNASILRNNLPQRIQLSSNTLGNDKREDDISGKTDHAKLPFFDHSGLDKLEQSTSGINIQKRDLTKKHNDELACNWDYLNIQCGSSVVPTPNLRLDTSAQLVETPRNDNVMHSKSLLPITQTNLENAGRKLFHGSADCYEQSLVDNVSSNYVSGIPPCHSLSQLVQDHQFIDTLEVPSDCMAMHHSAVTHYLRGSCNRNLFNEKVRDPIMSVHRVSTPCSPPRTTRWRSYSDDNYLNPVVSPVCPLPGLDLHFDALSQMPKDMVLGDSKATENPFKKKKSAVNSTLLTSEHNSEMNSVVPGNQPVSNTNEMNTSTQNNYSSQATTTTNAGDSGQENPKRKRQKCQSGDVDSFKRCSCKKSKCLKLYCECFAAKVHCSGSCSCRGCFNDDSHEETILSTRSRIESRNPLAFAPKVIRSCGSGLAFGEDSTATPASSRHKRGCNCKKSYCLKKYCECFESGVGCSMSCRCESCKNSFGIRKGIQLLDNEETERVDPKKKAPLKEELPWIIKLNAFGETYRVLPNDILCTTPSIESHRALVLPPSECSKTLLSSTTFSQLYSPSKTDVLPSPYRSYTQMILENDTSADMQQGDSSCTAGFKVVSPNKKRVSPMRSRSDRQLVLNSIPSFPSLTGDACQQ